MYTSIRIGVWDHIGVSSTLFYRRRIHCMMFDESRLARRRVLHVGIYNIRLLVYDYACKRDVECVNPNVLGSSTRI
jgi:hypothetical protein